ncbi:MAG: Clp protease ClpP, partial [Rhizobiales bacterium]|nr:Clp protease ClpP [Hyphomicrobiales bacterium]
LFTIGNSVEQAKATLAVSPQAKEEEEEDGGDYRPRRTMNAQGLNKPLNDKPGKDRLAILSASVDRTNKRR